MNEWASVRSAVHQASVIFPHPCKWTCRLRNDFLSLSPLYKMWHRSYPPRRLMARSARSSGRGVNKSCKPVRISNQWTTKEEWMQFMFNGHFVGLFLIVFHTEVNMRWIDHGLSPNQTELRPTQIRVGHPYCNDSHDDCGSEIQTLYLLRSGKSSNLLRSGRFKSRGSPVFGIGPLLIRLAAWTWFASGKISKRRLLPPVHDGRRLFGCG